MKTYHIILLFLLLVSIGACNTEMIHYQGKSAIYFAVQTVPAGDVSNPEFWAYTDTTDFTFTKTSVFDSVILLRVRVAGDIVNYDRPFTFHMVDSSTTAISGEDYEPLAMHGMISAGTRECHIPIHIHRTDKLVDTTVLITLELEAGSHFSLNMPFWLKLDEGDYTTRDKVNILRHTLRFHDHLPTTEPLGWWPGFFGKYTVTKIREMMTVLDLTLADFENKSVMDFALAPVIALEFKRYLQEQSDKGTPIYDENDEFGNPVLMTMGNQI